MSSCNNRLQYPIVAHGNRRPSDAERAHKGYKQRRHEMNWHNRERSSDDQIDAYLRRKLLKQHAAQKPSVVEG